MNIVAYVLITESLVCFNWNALGLYCIKHNWSVFSDPVTYVTVSEKTDHLAQVLDFEILVPHVACYSLYAMVKSESR